LLTGGIPGEAESRNGQRPSAPFVGLGTAIALGLVTLTAAVLGALAYPLMVRRRPRHMVSAV
jgi:hypothetical protein